VAIERVQGLRVHGFPMKSGFNVENSIKQRESPGYLLLSSRISYNSLTIFG
jgi:hypothetical protein